MEARGGTQLLELSWRMLEEQLCGEKRMRLAVKEPDGVRSQFEDEEMREIIPSFLSSASSFHYPPPSLFTFLSVLSWE